MSIFDGLSPHNLRIALDAARQSPEALAMLAAVCVLLLAAAALAAGMIGHHVGGFASRIREEDEAMREELDALERGDDAPQERKRNG